MGEIKKKNAGGASLAPQIDEQLLMIQFIEIEQKIKYTIKQIELSLLNNNNLYK